MELSPFQHRILRWLRVRQDLGGIKRQYVYRRWVISALTFAVISISTILALTIGNLDDLAVLLAGSIALVLISFSMGIFIVDALYTLAIAHIWPVLSEVVDWKRLDALIEQPPTGKRTLLPPQD